MTNALIPGYEAGFYTLPKELLELARAVEPLQKAVDDLPYGPAMVAEARSAFEASLLAAARAGKQLPTGKDLIAAKMAAGAQQEVSEVILEALRQAGRHERESFGLRQMEILVEHLQPAHRATVAAARKASADELPDLASRYSAIRGARAALDRLTPSVDSFGMFAEYEDLDEWFPQFYRERMREQVWAKINHSVEELRDHRPPEFTPPPWPSDPLDRFKWILANAQPWLPSPAEQGARFEQYIEKANAEHYAAVRRGNLARAVT